MTDQLRQAAQQALEALEELDGVDTETECVTIDVGDVITALKAALEQQAEPVAELQQVGPVEDMMLRRAALRSAKIVFAGRFVTKQAEPVAWDKPSASFNAWWDSYRHDPANPFAEGSAAYWAWAGWKSAQRQWVGLEAEDLAQIESDEFWQVGNHMAIALAVEAKLKERNHD